MIKRMKIIGTMILLLGFLAGNLKAGLVTIDITAEIIEVYKSEERYGGLIKVGDIMTGSYTYDSDTPDSNPSDPEVGLYEYTAPSYGVNLNAGGFVFQTDPAHVDYHLTISNEQLYFCTEDAYLFRSYNNLPLSNGSFLIGRT